MIRLRCEVPGGVYIPLVLPVRQITSFTITAITELLKGRFTQSSGSQKWLKAVDKKCAAFSPAWGCYNGGILFKLV